MEGIVSSYSSDMELGIIITADEKRYVFSKADWLESAAEPQPGLNVTFEQSRSCAQKVRMINPQP